MIGGKVMEIIEFSTPTCTYCKITHPQVVKYALDQGASLRKVNADSDSNTEAERDLCNAYEIMSVPTVVIRHDATEAPVKLVGFKDIVLFIKG